MGMKERIVESAHWVKKRTSIGHELKCLADIKSRMGCNILAHRHRYWTNAQESS
jgi:hypothetical protein